MQLFTLKVFKLTSVERPLISSFIFTSQLNLIYSLCIFPVLAPNYCFPRKFLELKKNVVYLSEITYIMDV